MAHRRLQAEVTSTCSMRGNGGPEGASTGRCLPGRTLAKRRYVERMPVRDDAAAIQDELVRLRRRLHRYPEVSLHLPRTQETVLRALDGLPLEVSTETACRP